jgi:Tol biopolymer transport system component/predicted Ser/Thr protein kinase
VLIADSTGVGRKPAAHLPVTIAALLYRGRRGIMGRHNPMQLEPGSRLGPYEITARLGAGGMGEVFQALDTRLDRSVAIKILPDELAESAQFKLRFEREAKMISQLNHPNICTLYDVGENYLVMELLDGESLADRIAKGPLPLTEALRYGIQIAEALDRAHRQGVIHRDLKPGNVMLTKSGAKLLDFGLAKAAVVDISHEDLTQHRALTTEGTILGTFQYMAPEQLEGAEAGGRTDIFALGCVLYEMVTGKRAFDGKTKTSLIAAIVSGVPRRVSEIQPLTPPGLEHVISRCLEKDPDDRWQSAHDIAEELKWINTAGSQAGLAAPLTMRRKTRERLAWSLLPVVALFAIAATWGLLKWRAPQPAAIESAITAPPNMRVSLENGAGVIAPDGSMLVLVTEDVQANRALAVRPLNADAFRSLTGTEGASYPFWSPDSRRIAFFAGGRLRIVDATGGAVQNLCDAPSGRGGSWGKDGTIVFAPGAATPLMKVAASGGVPQPATVLGKEDGTHRWPWFLPDGKRFLFLGAGVVQLGSLDSTTERRTLLKENTAAVYANGHLLYWKENIVIAHPFNVDKGLLEGDPMPLAEGVAAFRNLGVFSASGNGALLFQPGVAESRTELMWVDRSGKELGAVAPKGLFYSPHLSPDQRRVAVDLSDDRGGDIWIYELARNVSSRLTYEAENATSPIWSADGKRVFYLVDEAGAANIYQIPSGGTGAAELLLKDTRVKLPADASRDGRWLVFTSLGAETGSDIYLNSLQEKTAKPWLATPFNEGCAQLSPDGKWIAYQSDESGQMEIYVRAFPDSEEKWLISSGGGEAPAWRRDGGEIYYVSAERKMMAVAVRLEPSFDAGPPVALFEAVLRPVGRTSRQYDVSVDGTRFLLNRRADEQSSEPLSLVQNWTARLTRK